MQKTGITRRIDELGRVVIPKEIRRTMHLKEGEEMEISVDGDKLVLQKFSAIENVLRDTDVIALALSAAMPSATVIIADTDKILAVCGELRREYQDKALTRAAAKLIYARQSRALNAEDTIIIAEDTTECRNQVFVPVIAHGDALGAIIVICNDANIPQTIKLTELASEILSGII